MEEITFIFKPEKQTPPRKGDYYIGGVKLNPLRNTLDSSEFSLIKDTKTFKDFIDQGVIQLIENVDSQLLLIKSKTKKDSSGDLLINSLSINEATVLITAEQSLDQLERWKAQEMGSKQRKGILEALDSQIKSLND